MSDVIIGDIPAEPTLTTTGTTPYYEHFGARTSEPGIPYIEVGPERDTPRLPTRRTLRKAGRDFLVALTGFCMAYTASHQADLGLTPEVSAAIPVVALAIWRYGRGLLGAEPE